MHILLLNDDALPEARGGAAVIVDMLRSAYERARHKVTLITTHRSTSRDIRTGAGYVSLPSTYPLAQRHKRCLGDSQMTAMLEQVMNEHQPDAVHAHNIHTYLTYDALRVARRHTKKIVLTAHDTMLVSFDRVRGKRFERLALAGKPMRMRWWEHAACAGRKYWPPRNAAIRRVLAETGTTVVAISDAVAAFLQANGIAVAAMVRNGIDPWESPSAEEITAFRKRHGLAGHPVVLFVGRIREDKGVLALLRAAETVLKNNADARFMINGDSDDLAPFLENTSDAVRGAVIAAGWADPEQTRLSYFASDIVTVPSLYLDNFPTVNLEAMAAGKPVVGTCFGGTPEIVEDGVTGLIVNPRDAQRYADAVLTLLNDMALAQRMGAAGLQRLRNDFGLEKQMEAYMTLFR